MLHKSIARLVVVVFLFLIAPSIVNATLYHKVLKGNISVTNPQLIDVNGDGKADLIGLGPEVWLSNGDGTFQPGQVFGSGGAGPVSNAVADVDGDGRPDIIVFNACEAPGNCANSIVGVLLGNGDGTFQAAVPYNAGQEEAGELRSPMQTATVRPISCLPVLMWGHCWEMATELFNRSRSLTWACRRLPWRWRMSTRTAAPTCS